MFNLILFHHANIFKQQRGIPDTTLIAPVIMTIVDDIQQLQQRMENVGLNATQRIAQWQITI